ncbi:MAG TPA: hypothetical protein VH560_01205, partial [Polyangia bacterium]|nr:hypothetical protein [Polyangia bacterium]
MIDYDKFDSEYSSWMSTLKPVGWSYAAYELDETTNALALKKQNCGGIASVTGRPFPTTQTAYTNRSIAESDSMSKGSDSFATGEIGDHFTLRRVGRVSGTRPSYRSSWVRAKTSRSWNDQYS